MNPTRRKRRHKYLGRFPDNDGLVCFEAATYPLQTRSWRREGDSNPRYGC